MSDDASAGFELFSRRETARNGSEPYVRIDGNGNLLAFNAPASRMIEDVTHVRLLYDRDTRRIGFEPTGPEDPNGFSVTRMKSARNVGVRAFVRYFDIPVGVRFPLRREGSMWIAQVPVGPLQATEAAAAGTGAGP